MNVCIMRRFPHRPQRHYDRKVIMAGRPEGIQHQFWKVND